MAKVIDMTPEQEIEFKEWRDSRPPLIQEMIDRLPPDRLYRKKSTGKRVTLISYEEDRTVSVAVTGEFNAVMFDRRVFGVSMDDLEECDLPGPDEIVGTVLKDQKMVDERLRPINPHAATLSAKSVTKH